MPSRLRVLLLVVVLVALGAAILAVVTRARRPIQVVPSRYALVWDVPAELDETPPTSSTFSLATFQRDRPSLWEVSRAIRDAASDDGVRALVLHVGDVQWGWGRVAEMREAIAAFRASGKPVYASLHGGDDQSYLLVARADRIAMPPTETLYLDGLSATAMFLKGTYDKLGVSPNFAHVGQYKSAVEQYTRTNLSPPARLALESLLDDQYGDLVDTLASSRGLASNAMKTVVDEGPFTASEAISAGLVDTLLDESELDSLALRTAGAVLGTRTMARYLDARSEDGSGDQIALIPAVGTIVPGRSRDAGWNGQDVGSETLVNALRDACDRRSVQAIVLRIDSPGGSGEASDDVWREVQRVRRVKPVVVSMSNLAASGGYYIACGADAIVAEPGTITGSIGVFGGKLNVVGLANKLGISVESISRGRHAEMMSPFRDFTPEESARFQAQLEAFYRVFVGRVAQGRGMEPALVDSLGQGRVWSGVAARRFGLVDSLGGLDVAIGVARERAHVDPDRDLPVVLYPHVHRIAFRRFLGSLVDEEEEDASVLFARPVLAAWLRASRFPAGSVLAMLPYSIDVR